MGTQPTPAGGIGESIHPREDTVMTIWTISSRDATCVDSLPRPFRWAGGCVTTHTALGGAGR